MTDTPLLDFASSDERAGFRLDRLEVYNWGTFHRKVWTLRPGGRNTLLTGEIGTGKSTLVDAVTTLLVPSQKVAYNKAAGAEMRERTLRSYVLGHYKSERSDSGLSAKPVALRDQNDYSAILGVFRNEGFGLEVTLAQLFWIKDVQGPPARFFVVADRPMGIAAALAGFGPDLNALRKRLRADRAVELFDTFPPYGAAFRRRFGIGNEQALELFHQTVSMKSVGNLTGFVREHMLESDDVLSRIEPLIRHFDDLNRAHDAVLKAKDQLSRLTPLVSDCDALDALAARIDEWRGCRDALNPWFASLKSRLLEQRLRNLSYEADQLRGRIRKLEVRRGEQQGERESIRSAISGNGGDRIERIKTEIREKRQEKGRRMDRSARYDGFAGRLGLESAVDLDAFLANRRQLGALAEKLNSERDTFQDRRTEDGVDLRNLKLEYDSLRKELDSLRRRKSNIPEAQVAIRAAMCDSLGIPEESVPFAGEMVRVREEASVWEGAAERLLHNFGLSLLVPDLQYQRVAEWVDRNRLAGRLVYYRVREKVAVETAPSGGDLLVRKLAINPDSPFYAWIESELFRRFNHVCCDTMERFRKEQRAVTKAGQIKGSGERHEKDDRHRIDDRSRYVLGWSNEAKIRTLEGRARGLEKRMQVIGSRIAEAQAGLAALQERSGAVAQLEVFSDFADLDWRPLASVISELEAELQALESTSDRLRSLSEQLKGAEARIEKTEKDLDERKGELRVNGDRQERAGEMLAECRAVLSKMETEGRDVVFPRIESLREEILGNQALTVESCDNRERDMRGALQARIDAEEKKGRRLQDGIIAAMRDYRIAYSIETRDVDDRIESAGEYRSMLERLRTDDLPRFEARFRQLLKENTIREVVDFQSRLNRERETIRERVERINGSLARIDYNPGRYIRLEPQPGADAEIRDFQQMLRSCTEDTTGGSYDEQYSEGKFLQVKALIERFRGREGNTDADRRWTARVTDVRNWFVFSASERWREDDKEFEHYTDSGGKSGGQKEKLAYTVLAASLAYQFGLALDEVRSRTFRFVVIDEAFSRGSDESARYGLDLFHRLNLQLLIVTPLQKIHIIEPHVASVGFVHNEDGRESQLRNLTIEEYRAEREARRI